ncbi:MAG: hypothetical protein VYC09_00410, partial [Verrucomicrobiota bacterium]|nr:hypothetical protein [Verrucomicrobiota bacterium]
ILGSPNVGVGVPSFRSGSTASGTITVFIGKPLWGWNGPVARAHKALIAAPDGCFPVRIGIGLWLPSLVANERTTAKRSAR